MFMLFLLPLVDARDSSVIGSKCDRVNQVRGTNLVMMELGGWSKMMIGLIKIEWVCCLCFFFFFRKQARLHVPTQSLIF